MTGVKDDLPGIVANDERLECFFYFNFSSFNTSEPSPRLATPCVFISRLLSTRYLFHAHRVVYHWLKAVLMQLLKKGTSVTFSLRQIFSTFSI